MAVFNFTARVTVSILTSVEADSFERAVEIAKERELMSIAPDSYYTAEEFWIAEDLDGIPENITLQN